MTPMRAVWWISVLGLSVGLVACQRGGVKPPENYDVSGTITGDWGQSPKLRLALVGTGLPDVMTNKGNLPQNVPDLPTDGGWHYGVDIPTVPSILGLYQIVAYDDTDNSGTFNLGEPVARNRQYLIFSPTTRHTDEVKMPDLPLLPKTATLLPAMDLTRGWNLYDASQPLDSLNPRPLDKIMNYNLGR